MDATKQGLNKTAPTKVVKPSLAVIYMTTLIATNSPSSERGKSKSCEGIFPDYFIPAFQYMLAVYGEFEAIKVIAEYLSGSFGQFSQIFTRTCKITGGLFRRHHRPLRELFQCDACADV